MEAVGKEVSVATQVHRGWEVRMEEGRVVLHSRRDPVAGTSRLARMAVGGFVVVGAGSAVLAALLDLDSSVVGWSLALFGISWMHSAWRLWPLYSGRRSFAFTFYRGGTVEGVDTDGSAFCFTGVTTIRYSGNLLRFHDVNGVQLGFAVDSIMQPVAMREPLRSIGYNLERLGDDVMLPG